MCLGLCVRTRARGRARAHTHTRARGPQIVYRDVPVEVLVQGPIVDRVRVRVRVCVCVCVCVRQVASATTIVVEPFEKSSLSES